MYICAYNFQQLTDRIFKMNDINRLRWLLFLTLIGWMTSCDVRDRFVIEGVIDGGNGEMIYLEHTGLTQTTVLDSVRIDPRGAFHFRALSPPYPDFYRLRLGGRFLPFAIDSTEVITVKGNFDHFNTESTLTGSVTNDDIQLLRRSVARIQQKANQAVKGLSKAKQDAIRDELIVLIEEHKSLARPIILKNPRSAAAYFAIFQQVNGIPIFSPYEKEDRPFCAAVATSFHTFMPEYDRSKNLYATVMNAIQLERQARNQDAWAEMIENATTGYIDLSLPDRYGVMRTLSSLQGKTILLDFSAYESRESVPYTFALRELYHKFAARGFEIYQVSLDRNRLLWLDATENIPWITVRDDLGPRSPAATTYNVTSLPTYFLISPEGVILGRNMDLRTLEQEIQRHLP